MTTTHDLPAPAAMYRALVARDVSFDGVFLAAIRTTRIFCRPSCPARKPARENVEYFATAQEATLAGYRACLRCRPLTPPGGAPEWLAALLADVESAPDARWTDADLAARGLDPVRVRRWFLRHHAMTFHAFHRSRRVGRAIGRLRSGADVLGAGLDADFESASGFHEAFRKLTGRTPAAGRAVTPLRMTRFATPLGAMVAAATPKGLCLLEFADRRGLEMELVDLARRVNCAVIPEGDDVLRRTESEIAAYFDGTLRRFSIPLDLMGTPFQRRAWDALLAIPYGATRSYAQQAAAMGAPAAVRAAGRANGMNRVAIVVPCHRVVGADGELTGYGGGLWRKRRLLELERGAGN